MKVKGRAISIPRVKRQKCFSCNEEFFDHQANLLIDPYRRPAAHKIAV
jgi:hypothetical protein